jgi:alpha-L-arabinofuranosidase
MFLVNPYAESRAATIELRGAKIAAEARVTVLTSASADDANTFEEPRKIAPREEMMSVTSSGFARLLAPNSLTVIRLAEAK